MTGAERDLLALVKAGLQSTSQVLRTFWEQVRGIVSGATLTQEGRRPLMSRIDRVLDRFYGLTQRVALTSDLFRQVIAFTDLASELPFRRAIERLRGIVTMRDPALWERIRGMTISGHDDPFMKALRAMNGSVWERTAFLRAGNLSPQSRWVNADGTPYTLSQRVWRQGRDVRRQIDATIRSSIRRGDDVATLTKQLERVLSPDHLSTTFAIHRIVTTEIIHANGIATVQVVRVIPGYSGIRWALHAGHEHIDICDDNARNHSEGMDPGCYLPSEVPLFPTHPFDKCRLVPVVMNDGDVAYLLSTRYAQ